LRHANICNKEHKKTLIYKITKPVFVLLITDMKLLGGIKEESKKIAK